MSPEKLTEYRDALRVVMAVEELAPYRVGLFADRETVADALAYAYSMNDPAVTTAVHVLLNTVIKVLTADQEVVV